MLRFMGLQRVRHDSNGTELTGLRDAQCAMCSIVSDSVTIWTAAWQDSLSFTISQRLLKLMSIELVMSSNHLTLC